MAVVFSNKTFSIINVGFRFELIRNQFIDDPDPIQHGLFHRQSLLHYYHFHMGEAAQQIG
jgi:hypothetical protein